MCKRPCGCPVGSCSICIRSARFTFAVSYTYVRSLQAIGVKHRSGASHKFEDCQLPANAPIFDNWNETMAYIKIMGVKTRLSLKLFGKIAKEATKEIQEVSVLAALEQHKKVIAQMYVAPDLETIRAMKRWKMPKVWRQKRSSS